MTRCLDSSEISGMSCRLACKNCLTFCWWLKISALSRCSTLWLLCRCDTSLLLAAAAASSGDICFGCLGGESEISLATSSPTSSAPSESSAPSAFVADVPSASSPFFPLFACSSASPTASITWRLPSTAAIAAVMAAFDAPAADREARTAAPTKRSAALLPEPPSGEPGAMTPVPCSSAAVISVTSAQASAALRASKPKLMASTDRSAQPVESGLRWAAARHCAATSRVA
mmetsp:Transcript_46877/g.126496  ORF Transcript_46877/g.126496 Transcript_46877/m.126496 type:complete len:230 (+) Transcript_46877:530-1219(+)